MKIRSANFGEPDLEPIAKFGGMFIVFVILFSFLGENFCPDLDEC